MDFMKKLISLFIFTALFTGVVQSQAFTKDSFIANLGIGFGWYGYGYSVSSFPAISLSAEKGVWDIEDVGVISLGGIVGYKFSKYDWSYANYSYDWKWTDFVVAARSAIHPVLIDNDKVDFYGSLALGVRFEKYKYYAPTFMGEPQNYTDNDVNVLIAVYAGCRYYFSDHFAAFGEFGYGLGYFNLGVTYKL
jgi:hypothetical protein